MNNTNTDLNYDINDLEIWIHMLNESDLKGELDDDELDKLDVMKVQLQKLKAEKALIDGERRQTVAKQVIVVNRNLNMPQGKLAAQVAHASLGALIKCGTKDKLALHIELETESAVEQWLNGSFTKIVLYVKSDEKLLSVFNKAEEAGLPCALITDAGHTVFDKPTRTCLGIGPVFPNELKGITDKLRVL